MVKSNPERSSETAKPITPLRCFTGALLSGGLAYLMYKMAVAIAVAFAHTPVRSANTYVISISTAVRTLVNGLVALGAGVFGITALGLFLLGIKLIFQQLRGESPTTES